MSNYWKLMIANIVKKKSQKNQDGDMTPTLVYPTLFSVLTNTISICPLEHYYRKRWFFLFKICIFYHKFYVCFFMPKIESLHYLLRSAYAKKIYHKCSVSAVFGNISDNSIRRKYTLYIFLFFFHFKVSHRFWQHVMNFLLPKSVEKKNIVI